MTYAIGNIFYGINLKSLVTDSHYYKTDPNKHLIDKDYDMEDFLEDDSMTTQHYSGGGDAPVYFGIDLDEIDECTEILISNLKLSPTAEQIQAYNDKLAKAIQQYPDLAAYLNASKPEVHLTWGSS